MPKLTVAQIVGDGWQARAAFFSRLGGQAGLLRISDPARIAPQYNMARAPTIAGFSDGSSFSDGSGFANGMLPPTAYVAAARSRGDSDLVVGGLPASIPAALQPGDLLEIRPNGVPADFPHLYEVMVPGATNPTGQTGVEIRPRLRRDIAPGDMVVLSYPTSVFHLVDDSQGEIELSAPNFANHGFSLVEAIERT
ncbi:hypothetical protein [Bradyrhizobium sp. 153]|uniref:hypothetical protein n=1 Tax=Bradyrhizobium sp. 153 TaxID=2782627 RepID=UPI001FFB47E3|nr:hypothetical protein [Bradyrhizobium sp. 153]MCK1669442.1 hypothetical protein [Bradyrhizobium sp. 153]